MELPAVKILSALGLMILTFLAITSPLFFFRRSLSLYDPPAILERRKRIMSCLSCFSGGVFLATCLLDLFPDVSEQVNEILRNVQMKSDYPIAEFLISMGFIIILIVEQVSESYKEQHQVSGAQLNVPEVQPTVPESQSGVSKDQCAESEKTLLPSSSSLVNMNPNANQVSDEDDSHYIRTTYGSIQGCNEPMEYNITFTEDNSHSSFRSLLLLFALSIHSIFEGLAIGLQLTIEENLRLLVAVLIHKCIISFTLGMDLIHSSMTISAVILSNTFFSLASPVGILMGLGVNKLLTGMAMLVTSCILQGLAAGTFLYITLFEVLPKELSSRNDSDRLLKVFLMVVGYSFITPFIIFMPD